MYVVTTVPKEKSASLPLSLDSDVPSNTGKVAVVKGKGHPRTGHESPEGEYRCSSTLSLTSALDVVGGQRRAPAALPPGNRHGTHFIGGWVGRRAGLDGCRKSRPHRDSPDRPACS
jgi:hypothetical protein